MSPAPGAGPPATPDDAPQDPRPGEGVRDGEAESAESAELAARIVDAVKGVPEVTGVSAGRLGTVATYRPGRPVRGVAVHDEDVEVRVVVRPARPLPDIAASVREAVEPLAGGRRIDVVVEDLAGEPEEALLRAGGSSGADE